jgi:Domain of unknown function (DUF397)
MSPTGLCPVRPSCRADRGDPLDRLQSFDQYGRDPEGPGQHLGEPSVVRAGCIRPHEPRVAHFPGNDQPGSFCPFDLPVDRGMWGAGPRCDLSEAKFEDRITQQERKDLTLLLGAQDGHEGRRGSSIHYLKNSLQFADTWFSAAIRDSKDRSGPVLTAGQWREFITELRANAYPSSAEASALLLRARPGSSGRQVYPPRRMWTCCFRFARC